MEHFLLPVLALIIWTLLVLVLMLGMRVPQMLKIAPDAQSFVRDPRLFDQLPQNVIWTGANHTNLHEQPTLFYALMFYLYLTNLTPDWMLNAAWCYVGLRVFHSLVQITINHLLTRFAVYLLATGVLVAMCIGAVAAL